MRLCFFAALLFALSAPAQDAQAPSSPTIPQASVKFSFEWDQGFPWQKYVIEVQPDGNTHFDGTPNPAEGGDPDPFQQDFVMSSVNRRKIFALAAKLNYFRNDYDSHLKKIAQTGRKMLQYQSSQTQGSTTYNWSQNPDVQELTAIFQGIALTLGYGRKLAFQYRFDKLGMDQRMKELVNLDASHEVEELGAIEPILRKIANDPNMMHINRQSAQTLLKTINGPSAASQTPAQP